MHSYRCSVENTHSQLAFRCEDDIASHLLVKDVVRAFALWLLSLVFYTVENLLLKGDIFQKIVLVQTGISVEKKEWHEMCLVFCVMDEG